MRHRKLGFNYCACGPAEQWIWSACEICGGVETGCSAFGHTCLACFLELVEGGGGVRDDGEESGEPAPGLEGAQSGGDGEGAAVPAGDLPAAESGR